MGSSSRNTSSSVYWTLLRKPESQSGSVLVNIWRQLQHQSPNENGGGLGRSMVHRRHLARECSSKFLPLQESLAPLCFPSPHVPLCRPGSRTNPTIPPSVAFLCPGWRCRSVSARCVTRSRLCDFAPPSRSCKSRQGLRRPERVFRHAKCQHFPFRTGHLNLCGKSLLLLLVKK